MITSKSRTLFEAPAPATPTQFNVVAVAVFAVIAGAGLVITLKTNNPYGAIAGALLIWYAFYKLLRVPLPWGVLTRFAF